MSSSLSGFKEMFSRKFLHALHRLRLQGGNCNGDEVKLAADVSMAMTARKNTGRVRGWSHAMMENFACNYKNNSALKKILGVKRFRTLVSKKVRMNSYLDMLQRRRRALGFIKRYKKRESMLIFHKTKKLQRLIPGGSSMDSPCLLKETGDYIVALKTQVDVLQSLLRVIHNQEQQVEDHQVHEEENHQEDQTVEQGENHQQ